MRIYNIYHLCLVAVFVLVLWTSSARAETNVLTGLQPTGVSSLLPENGALKPAGLLIQLNPASTRQELSTSIKILILMTILSLAPSFVIMMTSFTRILIVLGFLRQAMGTQHAPPGQVLSGLAIFMTIFIMAPVWQQINTKAIQPYVNETISEETAWQEAIAPLRTFMLRQTGSKELSMFVEMSGAQPPQKPEDVDMIALIPAFMTSELKTAFQLGFLIYLPFLVVDLVVSASLMSLGMMMLPPMMISLPIKILFFVLADGWTLLIKNLVLSFKM